MRVSDAMVLKLKQLEGCRLDAYQDSAGVWTIGYGHTKGVKPGDRITLAESDELLREDLDFFAPNVARLVRRPMTQNQFDALVCFAFNVGTGEDGFGGSTLLEKFNAGDVPGAAEQFGRWIHIRGPEIELCQGTRGDHVAEWQKLLVAAGFKVAIDGDFGPKTSAATREWQKQKGKTQDGIARIRPKVIEPGLVRRRFWEVVRFLT
jgi:lysozyme